jgi:hypothetical protein
VVLESAPPPAADTHKLRQASRHRVASGRVSVAHPRSVSEAAPAAVILRPWQTAYRAVSATSGPRRDWARDNGAIAAMAGATGDRRSLHHFPIASIADDLLHRGN